MKNFDIVTIVCIIAVIYMVVGSVIFILKQLKYNLKFTVVIFISVVLGLAFICCRNYFENFQPERKVENFYQEMIKTFPDMNEGDTPSAEKFFAVSGDEGIFY